MRDAYDDAGDGIRGDIRDSYRSVNGPPADEVDDALATLRRSRAILGDASMMKAIRQRIEESREAVAAAAEEQDDG